MFVRNLLLAAALAMALPAFAQESEGRQAVPRGSRPQGDNPRTGTAVPRREAPPPAQAPPTAVPAVRGHAEQRARDNDRGGKLVMPQVYNPPVAMAVPAFAQEAAEGQRQAVPRGSRPQGDNPRTGTAVPRSARPPAEAPPTAAPAVRSRAEARARSGSINRGNTIIVNPPPVYRNYYYYPRRSYPYGYGAFGLGYFYYDPYRWYPGYYGYGSGYYPRYRSSFVFDIGELRLQVFPKNAQVFVDGYYAGTVDDYDGTFQALKLEAGAYQIRISAPGFEDLFFDVRINPGQKINYRGDLRRIGP